MMDADNKIINVLWADDQDVIGDLFPVGYEKMFELRGINLLAQAKNASELDNLLKKYENEVDAVITDANMPKSDSWDDSDERDFSGLVDILLHTIRSIKDRGKDVRFYLFTGRKKEILINDKNISKELKKYFVDEDRWFEKGIDNEKLFSRLREDFEKEPPIQYRIRNKYHDVFEAAEIIEDEASSLIMEGFLMDYNNVLTVPFEKFNSARQVLEGINMGCKENQLLPGHMSLNCFMEFLRNKKLNDAVLLFDLMPYQLIKEMELFLAITNKGSHNDKQVLTNLKQNITDLQQNNDRTFLYSVIHYILCDLLLWYKRTVKKYGNNPTIIWKGSIYKDSIIITDIGSLFFAKSCDSDSTYCGKINKDSPLSIGDKVGIIKFTENKRTKDVDYYVYEDGYGIIEKNYG